MHITGNLGRWLLAASALALVAGMSAVRSAPANAQSLQGVPVVRFYGQVTLNGQKPITNLGITASIGNTVCNATQTNSGYATGGSGTNDDGSYYVDVQSIPGCTTPGSTVAFVATNGSNGQVKAQQTGTVPQVPGTPVHLDLNFQAAATPVATTAPPPPPPPARTPTAAPPPPAPRPPAATATPAAKPVVQQAPAGVGGKQAPAYYAPPVSGARLPNTGTGGLLDEQTSATGWELLVVVLMAFGVGATGLVAHRRRG